MEALNSIIKHFILAKTSQVAITKPAHFFIYNSVVNKSRMALSSSKTRINSTPLAEVNGSTGAECTDPRTGKRLKHALSNECLKVLQAVVHLSVITHDALIGETDGKTLMLDIVGLAGGHELPLVTALPDLDLTYVSRGAKANAMCGLVGEMYRKLVDDRIRVIRNEFLLVRGARFLGHCGKVDLVDVEFLVGRKVTKHF